MTHKHLNLHASCHCAAGAQFTVAGEGTGERTIAASEFFLGYRKVDMQPHEVLVRVSHAYAMTGGGSWLHSGGR